MSDLPGYIDLSLYDVDVDELVNRAVADAASKLPEWRPREGHTEMVLMESLGLIVSELVFAINRLPSLTLEGLLGLYGLTRGEGSPAVGTALVTLGDTFGHVVPGGTTLRVVNAETGEEVRFTTDEDLEIAFGGSTGTVAITATEPGVEGNGFAVGTPLELVDSVAYVESVEISVATTEGTDSESDDDFYARGALLLSRLTTTLVLADHFTSAALEDANVGRAKTYDLYDGVGASIGSDVGHVTVVVAGPDGTALTTEQKNDLDAELTSKAVAGLSIHVIDPTITEVDVTVDISLVDGADPVTTAGAVEEAIAEYLSPATWEWGDTVYLYELVALIDNVPGVNRPTTFTTPTADVALTGDAGQLASAGTITVNVI